MKEKDIALLILITGFSLLISWFAFGAFINTPEDRQTEVPVVDEITANFPSPNSDDPIEQENYQEIYTIFKGEPDAKPEDKPINPTEIINIDESSSDPFAQ